MASLHELLMTRPIPTSLDMIAPPPEPRKGGTKVILGYLRHGHNRLEMPAGSKPIGVGAQDGQVVVHCEAPVHRFGGEKLETLAFYVALQNEPFQRDRLGRYLGSARDPQWSRPRTVHVYEATS